MDATDAKHRMLGLLRKEGLVVVLSTVDSQGRPCSRFMGGLTVEGEKTIYMATYTDARKVRHIEADPHVQVLASGKGWQEIVTVNGHAELEASPAKKQAIWDAHPVFAEYFSGPDAPEYGLIKITAETGEFISMEHAREPIHVAF